MAVKPSSRRRVRPRPRRKAVGARFSNVVITRSIIYYTNKERRRRNLASLGWHHSLQLSAQGHSRWMARNTVLSHRGSGHSTPMDRAQQVGYKGGVGENIIQLPSRRGRGSAWGMRWRGDWQLGKAAVHGWMGSPGHRENILKRGYLSIGIGVEMTRNGTYYLTQNFGTTGGSGGVKLWGKQGRKGEDFNVPGLRFTIGLLLIAGFYLWPMGKDLLETGRNILAEIGTTITEAFNGWRP